MPFKPKASRYWHYDFQIRGSRFHGSCGTEDFEEAKAVEAQARVQAKAQASSEPKKPADVFTISEAIGTYYTDISAHQPSARTSWGQGKAVLSVINPKTNLSDLTQADLQRFVRVRRAEVANGTVNRQLQYFGRAVRHMANVYGAKVPQLNFKSVETKEPTERVRELTLQEQDLLFQHLRLDLHPFVEFALMTGARRGSITELKWSDVNLSTRRMVFRLKGGSTMLFPISEELLVFLVRLPRSELPVHQNYVLTYVDEQTQERKRLRPSGGGGIYSDWKAALEKANISDFRFHDLRHTFATRLLRQTGNIKLVSRLLGHTTIETTTRYAHVIDEDLHSALDSFSTITNTQSRNKSRSKTQRLVNKR